ncbi:pre-mRNA-splicing factor CWC22 homolog [Mercenaria mercenaria]|uniref:pre-mRNA-splicing factor CWC22 homolog n=1 Tax=Mercenaria mercenaria TaxID=6596 RepID=UPI00234F3ACA|nr:pre-mRNA-splicing factor CWC22 homolog [Mercenaria mercenaria]
MPRKRHDTSSEDSDSSEEEVRSDRRDRRSLQGTDHGNQQYASPQKRSRGNQNARKRMDSERDSSPDSAVNRGREHQYSSDSDTSPVKRSVVSKVEKANAPGRVRDSREFDNRNRGRGDDRRNFRGANQGQRSNRRDDSQNSFGRRNEMISPDGRQRRVSTSPDRQRLGNRLPRRQERSNRSLSQERNDFRIETRSSFSPDRNARFGQRRNDNQGIGRGQKSPGRGQGWRDQPVRGRFEDNRGQGYRNVQQSRSFDRQDRGQDRNKQNRGRSRSPVRNRTRNDSDVSFEKRTISPEELRSNKGQRRQKSVSPARSNRDLRAGVSVSPVRSNRGQRSISPERSERVNKQGKALEKKKNTPVNSPLKSKARSGNKAKKVKENQSVERSVIDSDEEIEKSSQTSKKSKKKKKKEIAKDDSLERSFERSKQLLEESSHSKDFDIPEPDDSVQELSPLKGRKKLKSKRQREYSESEQEIMSKKSKKAKNVVDSGKNVNKKAQKKSKKRVSTSRSPSPDERSYDRLRSRSSDKNRSRSSERSFGRNHDMAQFESEPESGEITDSEEEAEQARQSMKSLINKPVGEEDQQSMEDERYLNQKKKASKLKERDGSEKKEGRKEHGKERGNKRKAEETKEPEPTPEPEVATKKPKPAAVGVEALTGRTGGAYIPPARLRAMQAKITDKSSVEFQRISWEALKKSINGLVNKVNVGNIENIVRELFQENIVRGRGLMARSIIQAQAASPTFTHVYAALVAIVNTKFPQNGELVLRRLIIQFRRGYKRNDKSICLSATRFIAHLVNQQVAHEILALEVLTLLLETPSDDSVEVAIGFLKECGQKLTEVSPRGINAIFERLRNILHEGQIDIRVQYMMEVMFAVRKDQFKDFPAVLEDLDLVEEEDQFTHLLTLEDAVNGEDILNVFKPDPAFEENEEKYKILKKEILGEGSSDEEDGSGSGSGSDSDEDSEEDEEAKQKIIDQTETNMVALRRTIYLTIQSSLDFEECAHKLMKMDLKPGQEVELCNMILDCCGQMRTYEKFFGLLAGRFCMIDKKYVTPFQVMFKEQYDTIHRLETNKLRNVAKFFAHLLHTDSISWAVLQAIRLNEDDTTSASRIFIKILFQELSEYLGLPKLNDRLKDPTLQEYYAGLLPRDNPRDTRFAINFFTTIGLGGLTDDLRDHLKDVSKKLMQQKQEEQAQAIEEDSDDDSDDSSDESDVSEDSESSDSSSESESDDDDRRKRKKADKKTKSNVEKDKRVKDKGRQEKVIEKDNKKNRDKTNGSLERRGRNDVEKDTKKDKKKNRKAAGDIRKDRKSEDEMRREQEEQFKKLAKLADYGNIEDLDDSYEQERRKGGDDWKKSKKDKKGKGKDKKSKKGKRESDNEDYDEDFQDTRLSDQRKRIPVELDEFDARAYADRSYDSGFEGRGGRGGGRDERGGGDRRDRRGGGGVMRGDRGGFEDRGHSRGDGQKGKGLGKKGRDYIEDDLDDRDIRIERNFERLDLYEEKFERERERNLEQVRGREEFQDYYRAREGNDLPRGGPYRGRDLPYKGGRDVDRFEFEDRGFDRGFENDRRRGRDRSEEQVPVSGRNDRRRRR